VASVSSGVPHVCSCQCLPQRVAPVPHFAGHEVAALSEVCSGVVGVPVERPGHELHGTTRAGPLVVADEAAGGCPAGAALAGGDELQPAAGAGERPLRVPDGANPVVGVRDGVVGAQQLSCGLRLLAPFGGAAAGRVTRIPRPRHRTREAHGLAVGSVLLPVEADRLLGDRAPFRNGGRVGGGADLDDAGWFVGPGGDRERGGHGEDGEQQDGDGEVPDGSLPSRVSPQSCRGISRI